MKKIIIKNKSLIISILLALIILSPLYYSYKKEYIKNEVYSYMKNKGCFPKYIKNVNIKYSLANKILSYNDWIIEVNLYGRYKFTFNYDKNKLILSGLNDNGELSKEDYKNIMEKLENGKLCTIEENLLGEKSDIKLSDDLISLKILKLNLKDNIATLNLINDTNDTYVYGEGYQIQVKKEDIWYEVNPINEPVFVSIAHFLEPNANKEIKINWDYIYGILPVGDYRIIKSLNIKNGKTSIHVGAEFTVN